MAGPRLSVAKLNGAAHLRRLRLKYVSDFFSNYDLNNQPP
jgi:hypothetical protein